MAVRIAPLTVLAASIGLIAGQGRGQTPPFNLLSNSQWEIWSAVRYGPRERPDGAGEMAPIAILGNTVGHNPTVLTLEGHLDGLKVGDLVTVDGPATDPVLKLSPMRVTALSARTAALSPPLGLAPSRSGAGVLQPVNIGMSGSLGTGDAADSWKKSPALMVWREDNPQNVWRRAQYALGARTTTAHGQEVHAELDARRFRGRRISFGLLASHAPGRAGQWRPFVQSDGTGAARREGAAGDAPGYQWRELAYDVPADATTLSAGVVFEGEPGGTFYVCDPVLAMADAIGFDNYLKPAEWLTPVSHISPITWVDAAITFPLTPDQAGLLSLTFDAYAETGGAIAPGVAQMNGSIEGIDSSPVILGALGSRVIAWRDNARDPIRLGPILGQYGVALKSFGGVSIPLDPDARARYFTAVPGDSWSNVSMDLDLFLLR
jgi:hypothetical protein